jgi:hypothetical protein
MVRMPMANGEPAFVIGDRIQRSGSNSASSLSDGGSVALAGELKVGVSTDKTSAARPSLDLTAHAVLTPYHVIRKRQVVKDEAA